MGKRDNDKFDRKPRDKYYTIDPAATNALVDHLRLPTAFIEPCAGAGSLVELLCKHHGVSCVGALDVEPSARWIAEFNCLNLEKDDILGGTDCFITNPPFSWGMLKPILGHLPTLLPTWLLLPADYMHNVRMAPYMAKCEKVVSVGRLYWETNKKKGVDNYAWYLFVNDKVETTFYGRKQQK